eukprot:352958-Chlamydomonas_euryale.AAC.9
MDSGCSGQGSRRGRSELTWQHPPSAVPATPGLVQFERLLCALACACWLAGAGAGAAANRSPLAGLNRAKTSTPRAAAGLHDCKCQGFFNHCDQGNTHHRTWRHLPPPYAATAHGHPPTLTTSAAGAPIAKNAALTHPPRYASFCVSSKPKKFAAIDSCGGSAGQHETMASGKAGGGGRGARAVRIPALQPLALTDTQLAPSHLAHCDSHLAPRGFGPRRAGNRAA